MSAILIVLLFTTHVCLAERDTITTSCYVQHFDNTNGLPQNSVKSIAKDSSGYIWLATENGLTRFDGAHFVNYERKNANITSNRFISFLSDPAGNLWGYNAAEERMKLCDGRAIRDTETYSHPRDFYQWYAKGDPKDTGTFNLAWPPETMKSERAIIRRLVYHLDENTYYECTKDKVTFYEKGNMRYAVPFTPGDRWDFFLLNNRLYYLHKNLTVTLFSDKPLTMALNGEIKQEPRTAEKAKFFWNLHMASQVVIYINSNFYLVETDANGLPVSRKIITGYRIKEADDVKNALYDEVDGKLYLGSFNNGLYILSRHVFSTGSIGAGEVYYGQTPYTNNTVLTAQGDILGTNGYAKRIMAIRKLIPTDYFGILTDSLHRIWVKWGHWLYQLDGTSFAVLRHWELPGEIAQIFDNGNGEIWLGMRKHGVMTLNMYQDQAKPVKLLALPHEVTFFARWQNTLYIATEKGCLQMDIPSGRTEAIPALAGKEVRSLYISALGEVWITTYGSGLYRYYKEKLTAFPPDANNYLSTAHCIIPDNQGFFWITTNNGLFQVSQHDLRNYPEDTTAALYYHYYDKSDGFLTNEFNGGCVPCAIKLDNGMLSLPSLRGLVFFNPDSIRAQLPVNHLFIDRIIVDKREMPVAEHLELPRKLNMLSFKVSSPYTGNRKNLQMTYSLQEGDHPLLWVPVPEDGTISLSMLSSGDYTLIIRKLNGFGSNNYEERKITFSVAAAWYQTSWFKLLCAAGLMGIWFLVVRLRIRYIQKRNAQLEEAVTLKTKELQQRTDIQERIIRSVSHDIQTPLRYQQLLSRKLYEGLFQERLPALTEVAKVMHDHTNRLSYMTDNLLKYLKIQVATEPLQKDAFLLAALVHDILMIFREIAREKGTEIFNYVPAQLQWEGNMQLLSVILHNLVDNAVKVTRHGTIIIRTEVQHNQTMILVKDTGPGMRPDLLQWLNEPGIPTPSQSGMGLMIVKELVSLLQLELYVSSLPDEGCCFCIRTRTS